MRRRRPPTDQDRRDHVETLELLGRVVAQQPGHDEVRRHFVLFVNPTVPPPVSVARCLTR